MKRSSVARIISLVVFLAAAAVIILQSHNMSPFSTAPPPIHPAPAGSLSLVTEPTDGISPELNLINGATKSIDLTMYELEDLNVEQALVAAQHHGVNVRVLLNHGYYGSPSSANQAAYNYFLANQVPVHWTPSYFALTHQKTLVVDGKTASIMTFNFTPKYYPTGRDFAVNDTDAKDVAAIEAAFDSDWNAHKTTAPAGDDLVWSPGSEPEMLSLIDSAKYSLQIYNEEMADTNVEKALENAARRGVNVQVVMTDSSSWQTAFEQLTAAGVKVHTYARSASTYIHAKMIIADGKTAFVGSENFSPTSLDKNRELGIVLNDPNIIASLGQTFASDYQSSTAF